MTCSPQSLVAKFHGNLDISTLGGAGFASQRTTEEIGPWDISGYDGLEITVDPRSDGKIYTVILKDDTSPEESYEGGRISNWEYDFRVESDKVYVKWDDFKPTFRGRPVEDARPLDLGSIRNFSLMARRCVALSILLVYELILRVSSFFGKQQGDFDLRVVSIAAVRTDRYVDDPYGEDAFISNEKSESLEAKEPEGWLRWLMGCFGW